MKRLWTPWRMPYLKGEPAGNSGTKPACIFCHKIGADDAAEHVLFRGETCFVTLNLFPYNNGHMMVVPYQHTGRLQELPPTTLTEMMELSQQAITVLERAYQPEGYNIGFNLGNAAGAGIVTHLHQHIVPRWTGDTNYMTVVGETRVIPEWIDETYHQLKVIWDALTASHE